MKNLFAKYTFFEIFQHWILVLMFIFLGITGFAQAKPFSEFGKTVSKYLGNLQNVMLLHRILGKIYILYFIFHLSFVFLHFIKGNRGLLLRRSDFDFGAKITNNRFNLRHKLDYFAVLFGSLVFIITGIILMQPKLSAIIITGTGVAIAREIHYNEAIIATSIVLFWHLFFAHFQSDVFPFNSEIIKTQKNNIFTHIQS